MRAILVRHGETLWNARRRVQGGAFDIELSPVGKEQAEKVARALKEEKVAAVYSSPLKRALETARLIAGEHGLEVVVEPDLREIEAGKAEGMAIEDLERLFPDFWEDWRQGKGSIRWPGGESLEELASRVWGVVERIRREHPDDTVVIVAHIFVLICLVLQALGLDLGNFRRLRMDVGSISVLNFDRDRVFLEKLNDTCHWRRHV